MAISLLEDITIKLQRIGVKGDNMGGRGSRSGGMSAGGAGGGTATSAFQVMQQAPNIQPSVQMAQQANARTFDDTDSRPYHDLRGGRNYFQSQNLTIDQQIATVNYLSDTPERGSLYSMSQNLNYNLATGKPLNANQQYVYNNMMGSMHNLGENLNLTRYDHRTFVDNLLAQNGVRGNMRNMSVSQLKQSLVGTQYGENKLISTSHNDFVNAPASSRNVFDTRAVKISYKAKADVQGMMPGNGPGGALGEMILAPSGNAKNFKIVDVKSTGKMARAPRSQTYNIPQIEIVVEVSKQS